MAKKRAPLQPALFADCDEDEAVSQEQQQGEEPAAPPTLVIRNAAQVVCVAQQAEGVKRGQAMRNLAVIDSGGLVVQEGQIAWIGPSAKLPRLGGDSKVIDASGKTVLPGFVDSHTPLIFTGSREEEFEDRLQGL